MSAPRASASPPSSAPSRDALELAADVAEVLEAYGLVACGRRKDGVARVDFWTREGRAHRFPVSGDEDVGSVVAACLELAEVVVTPGRLLS
ncbi:MAG: hypothetical protein IPQ09_27880 [Myxococcales bacterium]|nr:hypothetical protein [Myxococcales bacterium]HQY62893.1 hypothetical protein [Polyangiaceae bacterium]